jgi:AcrR family transcriptional regulator
LDWLTLVDLRHSEAALVPEGTVMGHRETIIAAATRLFDERGYSRTSVEDIADAADITRRTLYRHLGSKELVLVAIDEQFAGRFPVERQPAGTSRDEFVALIRADLATVISHRAEARIFFEERKHLSAEHGTRVGERWGQHGALVRAVLDAGAGAGELRVVDTTIAAQAMLGAVASLYEWFRPEGQLSVAQMADVIATMLLSGLVPAQRRLTGLAGERPYDPARDALPDRALRGALLDGSSWDDDPVLKGILDVAAQIFGEQGYDQASTRELAAAAGLTSSGLYHHIPDKAAVLYQLNLRLTGSGIRSVESIVQAAADPVAALHALMVWHCEEVARTLGAWRAFSNEARVLDAPYFTDISRLRSEFARMFGAAMRATMPAALAARADDVLAYVILGMLNFVNQWYRADSQLRASHIGDCFFEVIWSGLAANGE